MSMDVHEYAINAQLSLAAYANLDEVNDIDDVINALEVAGMSEAGSKTRDFLGLNENNKLITGKGFEIIHHEPDRTSGFSSTVFKDRDTGRYHLAIRGNNSKQDVADLIADANVSVLSGGAIQCIKSFPC
ncbi:MAG: hypothetical protein U5P41_02035 [Gammaproteobacteria bacterium]|nr:hypothetical protein [Gammaproteobacteria bacterium]